MFAEALLLVQVVAVPFRSATDQRPVRLWLGASPVSTGSAVPVYVAAASDGYLLVLRVATDGRVAVVFPADPKTNGFVTRGSYELRGTAGLPALIVNEGSGTGLVLAALSETPFRFTEFSRTGRWDGALLVASHPEADGPGTLTDIAQRMLGDGWFNSDFALYTVRSPQTAARIQQRQAIPEVGSSDVATTPDIATCTGCTIVYQTVSPAPLLEQTPVEQAMVEPVAIYPSACDVYSGNCAYYTPGYFVSSGQFNRHNDYDRRKYAEFAKIDHRRPPVKTEGICTIGIDCPRGAGKPAKVIPSQQGRMTLSPVRRPTPVEPATPPRYVATAGTQRVVALAKPTPVAAQGAPIVRRGAAASTIMVPVGIKTGVMPRRTVGGAMRSAAPAGAAAGAMTSRQMGTAMRASKALARRR